MSDTTEDKDRLTAALAIASLADSVPNTPEVSPETESNQQPQLVPQPARDVPHLQVQSAPTWTPSVAVAKKIQSKPGGEDSGTPVYTAQYTGGVGHDAIPVCSLGAASPLSVASPLGVASPLSVASTLPMGLYKGAVLPKVPRTMLVKNALVQKIQNNRQNNSSSPTVVISSSGPLSPPTIITTPNYPALGDPNAGPTIRLSKPRGKGRGRGRGRPRGRGGTIHQMTAYERPDLDKPPVPESEPSKSSQNQQVSEVPGIILVNTPESPSIAAGSNSLHSPTGLIQMANIAVQSPSSLVQPGSLAVQLPVGSGATSAPSVTIPHVALHEMKLPEDLKEKYQQALLRQHLAGVSPITPPEQPTGLIPSQSQATVSKEQSEPLDLSKDGQKTTGLERGVTSVGGGGAQLAALPPGMFLTQQGGMLLSPGANTQGMLLSPLAYARLPVPAGSQGSVPIVMAAGSNPMIQPYLINPLLLQQAQQAAQQAAQHAAQQSAQQSAVSPQSIAKQRPLVPKTTIDGTTKTQPSASQTNQPMKNKQEEVEQTTTTISSTKPPSTLLTNITLPTETKPSLTRTGSSSSLDQTKLPPKKRKLISSSDTISTDDNAVVSLDSGIGSLDSPTVATIMPLNINPPKPTKQHRRKSEEITPKWQERYARSLVEQYQRSVGNQGIQSLPVDLQQQVPMAQDNSGERSVMMLERARNLTVQSQLAAQHAQSKTDITEQRISIQQREQSKDSIGGRLVNVKYDGKSGLNTQSLNPLAQSKAILRQVVPQSQHVVTKMSSDAIKSFPTARIKPVVSPSTTNMVHLQTASTKTLGVASSSNLQRTDTDRAIRSLPDDRMASSMKSILRPPVQQRRRGSVDGHKGAVVMVNGRGSPDNVKDDRVAVVSSSAESKEARTTIVSDDNNTEVIDNEVNAELLQECQRAAHTDEDGDLPLHIAVVHENLAVVEKLMYMMHVAKVPLDHYNNLRQTPLHLAIITKNEAIAQKLLLGGANPALTDRNGQTCVHLCVQKRTRECLELVLTECLKDPDIDSKNYEGFTALHMAVIANNPDYVELLIDAGANLDILDGKSGRTPLFHAAENKQFNIASMLLQAGASVNICNYSGSTPVQAANGRGHTELVALLIKYGADVSNTIKESDQKRDENRWVVTQNMAQVKATVRENTLKRQRRKQQLKDNKDKRTVQDFLLKERMEASTPPGDEMREQTRTPPGQEQGNKSTDPRLHFRQFTTNPIGVAGSPNQNFIELQKALLEKIAPTNIASEPIDLTDDADVAMETGSPGNKRPVQSLSIDPKSVTVPAKKLRLSEGEETSPIMKIPSPNRNFNIISNPSLTTSSVVTIEPSSSDIAPPIQSTVRNIFSKSEPHCHPSVSPKALELTVKSSLVPVNSLQSALHTYPSVTVNSANSSHHHDIAEVTKQQPHYSNAAMNLTSSLTKDSERRLSESLQVSVTIDAAASSDVDKENRLLTRNRSPGNSIEKEQCTEKTGGSPTSKGTFENVSPSPSGEKKNITQIVSDIKTKNANLLNDVKVEGSSSASDNVNSKLTEEQAINKQALKDKGLSATDNHKEIFKDKITDKNPPIEDKNNTQLEDTVPIKDNNLTTKVENVNVKDEVYDKAAINVTTPNDDNNVKDEIQLPHPVTTVNVSDNIIVTDNPSTLSHLDPDSSINPSLAAAAITMETNNISGDRVIYSNIENLSATSFSQREKSSLNSVRNINDDSSSFIQSEPSCDDDSTIVINSLKSEPQDGATVLLTDETACDSSVLVMREVNSSVKVSESSVVSSNESSVVSSNVNDITRESDEITINKCTSNAISMETKSSVTNETSSSPISNSEESLKVTKTENAPSSSAGKNTVWEDSQQETLKISEQLPEINSDDRTLKQKQAGSPCNDDGRFDSCSEETASIADMVKGGVRVQTEGKISVTALDRTPDSDNKRTSEETDSNVKSPVNSSEEKSVAPIRTDVSDVEIQPQRESIDKVSNKEMMDSNTYDKECLLEQPAGASSAVHLSEHVSEKKENVDKIIEPKKCLVTDINVQKSAEVVTRDIANMQKSAEVVNRDITEAIDLNSSEKTVISDNTSKNLIPDSSQNLLEERDSKIPKPSSSSYPCINADEHLKSSGLSGETAKIISVSSNDNKGHSKLSKDDFNEQFKAISNVKSSQNESSSNESLESKSSSLHDGSELVKSDTNVEVQHQSLDSSKVATAGENVAMETTNDYPELPADDDDYDDTMDDNIIKFNEGNAVEIKMSDGTTCVVRSTASPDRDSDLEGQSHDLPANEGQGQFQGQSDSYGEESTMDINNVSP